MAEIQEDLTDEQNDYARDTTSDALDDMASDYEESKKKEIKILEDTISSEEKLYQLAIARIDSNWEGLYDDLIKWIFALLIIVLIVLKFSGNRVSNADFKDVK